MKCSACGAECEEEHRHCPGCGRRTTVDEPGGPVEGKGRADSAVAEGKSPPNMDEPGMGAAQPEPSRSAPRTVDTPRPPGVLQYLFMLCIAFLPVVNLVVFFLWAVRSGVDRNRKNFARAYLLFFLVAALVTAGLTLAPKGAETALVLEEEDLPSEWAVSEIVAAMDRGIIDLDELRSFRADITREQLVRLLVFFYESRSGQPVMAHALNPYTDTSSEAVLKAIHLGIINPGSGQSTAFRPNDLVTRQEISVMLLRTLLLLAPDLDPDISRPGIFNDSTDIADWALEGMYFAFNHGVISTYNGQIAPGALVTREQAMVCIGRLDAILRTAQ